VGLNAPEADARDVARDSRDSALERMSVSERASERASDASEQERKKATVKKRVSGGVMLFAPGAMPNLGAGMLKKTAGPRASIEPKTSSTFERPALKHVARPSDKKLVDAGSAKALAAKKPSMDATREEEGEEEGGEEGEEEHTEEEARASAASAGRASSLKDADAEEWEERRDPSSGVSYYYNLVTSEASWEVPAVGFVPMEHEEGEEWEQRLDAAAGVHYYYNVRTQEAVWEAPERYKAMEEAAPAPAAGEEEVGEDWETKMDEASGYPYYQHKTTGQAVWTVAETKA
jgi:hypothetical protein